MVSSLLAVEGEVSGVAVDPEGLHSSNRLVHPGSSLIGRHSPVHRGRLHLCRSSSNNRGGARPKGSLQLLAPTLSQQQHCPRCWLQFWTAHHPLTPGPAQGPALQVPC